MQGDKPSTNPQPHTLARNHGRPVVDHLGVVYPSCLQASVANGISPTTGYFRALAQRHGWRFVDQPPRKPAPSSAREG